MEPVRDRCRSMGGGVPEGPRLCGPSQRKLLEPNKSSGVETILRHGHGLENRSFGQQAANPFACLRIPCWSQSSWFPKLTADWHWAASISNPANSKEGNERGQKGVTRKGNNWWNSQPVFKTNNWVPCFASNITPPMEARFQCAPKSGVQNISPSSCQ